MLSRPHGSALRQVVPLSGWGLSAGVSVDPNGDSPLKPDYLSDFSSVKSSSLLELALKPAPHISDVHRIILSTVASLRGKVAKGGVEPIL